jgi:hypothetical protein
MPLDVSTVGAITGRRWVIECLGVDIEHPFEHTRVIEQVFGAQRAPVRMEY